MASLKKTNAWKWFALYIKERDNWTCQTCGKSGKGRFMNAGHYIQAYGHSAVVFDEHNVVAQCMNCNLWGGGEQAIMRDVIIKRWGEEVERGLWEKAKQTKQYTKKELDEIARHYREKVKELRSLK